MNNSEIHYIQTNRSQLTNENNDPYYRKLSARFYGDRIITIDVWQKLEKKVNDIEWIKRQLLNLWPAFLDQIENYNPQLLESYKDYLYNTVEFIVENNFPFKKASCLLEIMYEIFQYSVGNKLDKQRSLSYFKDLVIRHCLFRPPSSIDIFTKEDLDKIVDFVQNSFYRYYNIYMYSFTPFVNVEIRTHQMFKSRFQFPDSLNEAQEIPRANIQLLDEYLIDRDTGLTPEQLEEIMRGDSIHRVPAKKRQEWLRQKEERERKEKIEKVLLIQLEKMQVELDQKMQEQDDNFLQKVQDIKNPPKKK